MAHISVDSTTILKKNLSISSTYELTPIDVQQVEGYMFQITWKNGSTPIGIVEIHCSSEETGAYVKVDGSTVKIKDNEGSIIYNSTQFHYRYMKLVFDITTGSADFDIVINSRSRRV